jgi:predicted O-linked N-acetylglucosamine transferase (SPINDLY family)
MKSSQSDELFKETSFLHRLGKTDEALKIYQKLIKVDPSHVEGAIGYISLLTQIQRWGEALQVATKINRLQPKREETYIIMGGLLVSLERYEEALSCYEKCIKTFPDRENGYFNRAIVESKLLRINAAIESFQAALKINEKFFDACLGLANAHHQNQDYQTAIDYFEKALTLNPISAVGHNNRALAYLALGDIDKSLDDSNTAVSLDPSYAEAFYNLGNILATKEDNVLALNSYDKAIKLGFSSVDIYLNKATVLSRLNRYQESFELLTKLIESDPRCDRALVARAIIFGKLRDFTRAENDIVEAVSINPENPFYYGNLGIILRNQKKYKESLLAYKRALSIAPKMENAPGEIVSLKMYLCDWEGLQQAKEQLEKSIDLGKVAIQPLTFLSLSDDIERQYKCAKIFSDQNSYSNEKEYVFDKSNKDKPLNIGYFSADFHSHATMHLIAEYLENHDRTKFKIFAFSFGPDFEDDWRMRARAAFDEFIDVRGLSDAEIVALAREKHIMIALDLKGFTEDCRPQIFKERAAPIQINFLGYPGTMASSFIDYIVADKTLIPETERAYYEENIIYLPHSYQPNCRQRDISSNLMTREQFGLSEEKIIFCSFNGNHKITPEIFQCWLKILSAVERSQLWLYLNNTEARENLREEARRLGIDTTRLIFAETLSVEEHLARLRLADIFLDTYPYNAHTTASDALRVGLPIITLAGRPFASRVCASLLSAIGEECLITHSLDDYVNLAVRLGSNTNELAAIKSKIAQAVQESTLFDSNIFVKNFEKALTITYKNYINGNASQDIIVDP